MAVPTNKYVREKSVDPTEALIKRFRRVFRKRLRRLARDVPQFCDLLQSFPAAAVAIATGRASVSGHGNAVAMVRNGASLKSIAAELRLPYWFRKLPPEAFSGNLPSRLPVDAELGSKLQGLIPDNRLHVAGWLAGVIDADAYCGGPFTLWVARHPALTPSNADPAAIQLLALYAWHSQVESGGASQLSEARWNDRQTPERVANGIYDWLDALRRELLLGRKGIEDTWLAGGRAAGYRIVALVTADDLKREAEAMDNCVIDYVDRITQGECRLFSVRRGASHVATVEIRPHRFHARMPEVVQLYGPDNEPAPDRVWCAVFSWLGGQGSFNLPEAAEHATPDASAWQAMWRPYWRECGSHPLLPEHPNADVFARMDVAADLVDSYLRRG